MAALNWTYLLSYARYRHCESEGSRYLGLRRIVGEEAREADAVHYRHVQQVQRATVGLGTDSERLRALEAVHGKRDEREWLERQRTRELG